MPLELSISTNTLFLTALTPPLPQAHTHISKRLKIYIFTASSLSHLHFIKAQTPERERERERQRENKRERGREQNDSTLTYSKHQQIPGQLTIFMSDWVNFGEGLAKLLRDQQSLMAELPFHQVRVDRHNRAEVSVFQSSLEKGSAFLPGLCVCL